MWVQKTRAFISNDAVLYINYTSMLSFAPAISLAVENKVSPTPCSLLIPVALLVLSA